MEYREILDDVRSRFDSGDSWGSVTGELFGIANALSVCGYGDSIPDEWDYRPSPIQSRETIEEDGLWPDVSWLWVIDDGTDTEEIVRVGALLFRYKRLLERAGRDY